MTRTLSEELQSHIEGETTTLALLWRITRRDAVVLTFTDSDQDITYDSELYTANSSFAPTSIRSKDDLSADNLDVIGILSTISEADIASGKYDFAEVEIMSINYADTSQGVTTLLKGWLGRVVVQNGQFIAEIRSLSQKLQISVGRLYTAGCDAILGDSRCTVNLASFTFEGEVTSLTDNSKFVADALTQDIAYFTSGVVNWTVGENAGLSMEVKEFSDAEVSMVLPMPYTIQIGDEFEIVAGCDKLKETCQTKYNNFINFRGFPDVPGTDKIMETAGTFTSESEE